MAGTGEAIDLAHLDDAAFDRLYKERIEPCFVANESDRIAAVAKFEWELEQRHALGARYAALLADVPGLRLLAVRPDRDCVWAQYTVFVAQRGQVQAALKDLGIPTAVHYPKPLHLQPAYAHLCCLECCPQSVQAGEVVMSLPMSADLTPDQQDRTVAAVRQVLASRTVNTDGVPSA